MDGTNSYLVVTPEAVALDLSTASVVSRALARLLDVLVLAVVEFVVLILSLLVGGGTVGVVVASFAGVGALLAYPTLTEGLGRGQTIGKKMVRLRVVRADGGPIGVGQAAARAALGLVEVFATVGSLGVIVMLVSKREQRLGDMAAGTLVLRERRPGQLWPARLLVPPGCDNLVPTLDVGAMTGADYEQVRAFLLRWSDFRPQERSNVAAKIAAPLWQRSRHALPPGLGPDIYLACLGCAYQLRYHGPLPAYTAPGYANPGYPVPVSSPAPKRRRRSLH